MDNESKVRNALAKISTVNGCSFPVRVVSAIDGDELLAGSAPDRVIAITKTSEDSFGIEWFGGDWVNGKIAEYVATAFQNETDCNCEVQTTSASVTFKTKPSAKAKGKTDAIVKKKNRIRSED
tara:strand:+ start:2615 stop:2983 length:369 start_codon:yes stop_codon:yes gene_type:complete